MQERVRVYKFSNKICKASNVYLFAWSSICQNQTKLLFANAKEGCLEGGFVEHALMTLKLLDFFYKTLRTTKHFSCAFFTNANDYNECLLKHFEDQGFNL